MRAAWLFVVAACDPAFGHGQFGVDAAPRCTSTSCVAPLPVCGVDGQCHECATNLECNGGVCLPDQSCTSADTILYAAPAATGDCSMLSPCSLPTAVDMLSATRQVIELAAGNYLIAPVTIARNAVIVGAGATTTVIRSTSGTVITVSAGATVSLDHLAVMSSNADNIACDGSTLTVFASYSNAAMGTGIVATGCTLNVDRSQIFNNYTAAISATDSQVEITNNFVYGNGNANNSTGGAVRLLGSTLGDVAYDSIAFNIAKSTTDSGVTCASGKPRVRDTIIAGNIGKQINGCSNSFNYVSSSADSVRFASPSPPYDLHLTAATPTQAQNGSVPIRDNSNTTGCIGTVDIDDEARPAGTFCDLGGDEYN